MMQEDTSANSTIGTEEKVVSQLTDALDTQVTVSGGTGGSLPPPSSLPPQFSGGVSVSPIPTTGLSAPTVGGLSNSLLSSPQPLLMPTGGSPSLMTSLPTITPGLSAPTTSMPILQPQAPTGVGASLPPPPKTGFQPVPHSLHDYESHHSSPQSQPTGGAPSLVPTLPQTPPQQTGVNIFTPAYDPSAAPSPYSAPPANMSMQHTAPTPPRGGDTAVNLSFDMSGAQSDSYSIQSAQASLPRGPNNLADPAEWIEWLKTNETVRQMMQKAKTGVQTVITTMDPQMKDVLYSGGDIDIMVASSKAVKVEPVKEAFQRVFGRATVNGRDSQPGIAPQPVGYASGIKGAEERIGNLRRSGLVTDRQVCVAVESFIVDLQPEMWYDISCILLSDPVNNITIQTFSQATPVNLEYVQQAQGETAADYPLAWSGLSTTVGQIMHRQCAVDPSDWHYYFTGISRRDTLLLAAKQLAYIYKQRLPRS